MKGSTTAVVLMVSVSLVALLLAGGAGADESIIRLPVGQGEDAVTEETRPWDCCDRPVCTRSDPPLCGCKDVVQQCFATCKSCKPAKRADESAPSGYMCRDAYRGYPGPKCML
ncbi:Bowman-Birk type major trypsin inhibitor [Aegilops tauschii subsp. strangulata]|uniref:Bowman-Birk type major trypsin inhibitor n=1 Tax=Aegilops tauschii subsp. strangulata TaxID=200361 RepID=UPI000989BF58|nr:Bowman-Birk type major trypsin inhibitor [Aegilops tauschii subsp. strangulata]